jgi:hypothetical protein
MGLLYLLLIDNVHRLAKLHACALATENGMTAVYTSQGATYTVLIRQYTQLKSH